MAKIVVELDSTTIAIPRQFQEIFDDGERIPECCRFVKWIECTVGWDFFISLPEFRILPALLSTRPRAKKVR